MELISFIIFLALAAYLSYSLKCRIISDCNLNCLIKEYYQKQSVKVQEIESLTMKEKLRYSIPSHFIFEYYHYFFTLFTQLQQNYYRKIYLDHQSEVFELVYLDLKLKKGNLLDVKVFDKFEL